MNAIRRAHRTSRVALISFVALVFAFGLLLTLTPFWTARSAAAPLPVTQLAVTTPEPCDTWNLADSFRAYPNQENPNRDSCGNLSVWHFMESAGLARDPQSYTLLPYFTNTSSGILGLEKWTGSDYAAPPNGLPEVVVNTTQAPVSIGAQTFPPGVVVPEPSNGRLAVIAWRSPVTGVVNITGQVKDLNASYGDGILWFIDSGSAGLASGSIINGGSQDFRNGTGGTGLSAVPVKSGHFIYFAIHPNGYEDCDSTQLDITISLVSGEPGFTIAGTVTDAMGRPRAGAVIGDNEMPRVVTGPDGMYAFNVYTGTHTVSASRDCFSFSPPAHQVTAPPGASGLDFASRGLCALVPVIYKDWPPLPVAPALNPIVPRGYNSYELSWTQANLAMSYSLQEDVTSAFANPTRVYEGLARNWTSGPKAPGTYCYRVQGVGAYGGGAWSNAVCGTVAQYKDDFARSNSGWPISNNAIASLGYVDGEYQILVKEAGYLVFATADLGVTNYFLEVDGRAGASLGGGYGLIFSRTASGYYVYQFEDGYFMLTRVDTAAGSWSPLIGWTPSPAIHPGNQPNRLGVVRQGTSITLLANGQQLAQLYDGSYISGKVGMATGAETANFDARFDNLLATFLNLPPAQVSPQPRQGDVASRMESRVEELPADMMR